MLKNNTRFNEAFATVVGEQGATRWLQQQQPGQLKSYHRRLSVQADFLALINAGKEKLNHLYLSPLPDSDKRQQKQRIFSELKQQYEQLKNSQWGGRPWYDHWFNRPLNNAHLASVATYYDLVPTFEALLERCDGDFSRFYEQVKKASGKSQNIAGNSC